MPRGEEFVKGGIEGNYNVRDQKLKLFSPVLCYSMSSLRSSSNCTRHRALYAKMYVITDGNTQCIEFMRCGNFNFSVYIYGKEIKITIR